MVKASASVVLLACLVVGCERKAPPAAVQPAVVTSAAVGAAPEEGAPEAKGAPSGRGRVHVPPGTEVEAQRQFSKVEFPEVPIRAGATTKVHVAWKAPEGTGVNEEAPFRVRWSRSDALAEAPADVKASGNAARDGFDIVVKPLDGAPNATLTGIIDLVVCDVVTHAVCVPVRRKVEIEFVVGKSAAAETKVTVDLPQAKPQ